MSGRITGISGTRLTVEGLVRPRLGDAVRAGAENIPGEIISIQGSEAAVKLWEMPCGLAVGDAAQTAGEPPMVELGPGLLGQVFDAGQRPMHQVRPKGNAPEMSLTALDRRREWDFLPTAAAGQIVRAGDVLGAVQETARINHKILVPQGLSGVIVSIQRGKHSLEEPVAVIKDEKGGLHEVSMLRRWSLHEVRPYKARRFSDDHLPLMAAGIPPLEKGGSAVLLAPAGGGKTRRLQAMSRTAEADVFVCIACGRRGSELRAWLEEMRRCPEGDGGCRMDRCVFVSHSIDRPADGREAAVYTGLVAAEYFRDMGLDVLVLLDSLDAWAETLPATATDSVLGRFFARAGEVDCLGGGARRGSLSLCAAVRSGTEAAKVCRRHAGMVWECGKVESNDTTVLGGREVEG